MLGGIGFIGLLTSTITDFFTSQDTHVDQTEALKELTKQVNHLSRQVDQMPKELKKEQGQQKPAPNRSIRKSQEVINLYV